MISNVYKNKYSETEKSSEKQRDSFVFFSAGSCSYTQKPQNTSFGYISNQVRDGYRFDSSIKELAYDFIAKGKPVSPAIFIGKRGRSGFVGSQSIWLDFDSKEKIITPDEVYHRLLDYGIRPNIFYHTFGHSSKIPKFRYVIALDSFIKNGYAYEYLLDGFNKIFTNDDGFTYLDQNCIKDISRIYHGTNADFLVDHVNSETHTLRDIDNADGSFRKEVIFYRNQLTKYEDLKLLIDSFHTDPFNKNCNGFRKVKDFDISLNTHCKLLDKEGNPIKGGQSEGLHKTTNNNKKSSQMLDDDNRDLTCDRKHYNIYNSTCGDTSPFSHYQGDNNSSSISDYRVSGSRYQNENEIIKITKVRGIDFYCLMQTLKIVKDFVDGKMMINGSYVKKNFDYHTLKLFTISFLRIEGGIKWMTEVMNHHRENGLNYKDEDFALLKNLQHKRYKNKYHNPNLASFSPHEEDHSYTTIYQAAKSQFKGKIEINKSKLPKPMPLHKAEKQLLKTFRSVYRDKNTGTLDLILAETGLGKTRLLINEINHPESKTIIAFPTHQKKDEFVSDLESEGNLKGKDFIVSPRVPDFAESEHQRMLEMFYQSGLFGEARSYIKTIQHMEDVSKEDKKKANTFDAAYDTFMQTLLGGDFMGSVITTHKMAYHFDFAKISQHHQTFIFDEDLYSTGLITTDHLTIDELKHLSEIDPGNEPSYQRLLGTKEGIYVNNLGISSRYIENQFLNCWMFKEKGVWNKMLAFSKSEYFGVIKEKTKKGFKYKILFIKKIKPKQNKKYIVLSATAPSDLYKFRGIKVQIHNQCRFVKKKGKLIQYTAKSYSKQSLKRAKELPANPDNLTVITFMSHKSLFEGASQNIHFFNSLGYNDHEGESIQIVGTLHQNPYVLVLLALATGLDIDITDESLLEKQNQKVVYNGLGFILYTFKNKILQNLSNQLTESELQQTVGRARLLRYDATVHLYSNFPLWMADEFIY